MTRQPYTFLRFCAAQSAHAVELHPSNIELWRTLCGIEYHRTTGAVVPGARRCRDCRMEVQRRGTYTPGSARLAQHGGKE